MKSIYYACFLGLCFCQIGNTFAEELTKNLTIDSIAPDLFIVTHAFPWPSNSAVAIMENADILLIDVPYTPEATFITELDISEIWQKEYCRDKYAFSC